MKTNSKFWFSGILGCFQLLCSCTAIRPSLPADVALSENLLGERYVILDVRLESGEKLPFIVDTGAPATLFDKSLEPKLGPRLGNTPVRNFGTLHDGGIYHAPKLYLGDTPLQMKGNGIITWDFKEFSAATGRPILGILGMDILENYCFQLDFKAHKMRFLDAQHLNHSQLGTGFPITFSNQGQGTSDAIRPFIHQFSLIGGENTDLLIDTGYPTDGAVKSKIFSQEINRQRLQNGNVIHGHNGRFWFSQASWNGRTFTNLLMGDGGNLIGLKFLERHLVTFDFPGRMLYLKPISTGPLLDEKMKTAESFINDLRERGQLPGWTKNDQGTIYLDPFYNFDEFDGRKNGDRAEYHYEVAHQSKDGPLQLRKAWKTDENNQTVEEYPQAPSKK